MPEISAEKLKSDFQAHPKAVSKVLGDSLRDFGYPVTDEWVENEINSLLAGNEPSNLGPAMFLKRWLEEGID